MGNTLPFYITVKTWYKGGFYSEVFVEDEDGTVTYAHLFNR